MLQTWIYPIESVTNIFFVEGHCFFQLYYHKYLEKINPRINRGRRLFYFKNLTITYGNAKKRKLLQILFTG